jgi:hypothetical protein
MIWSSKTWAPLVPLDKLRASAQRNIVVGIFEDGCHARRPGEIEVREPGELGVRAVAHHNFILSCSMAAFWQRLGAEEGRRERWSTPSLAGRYRAGGDRGCRLAFSLDDEQRRRLAVNLRR